MILKNYLDGFKLITLVAFFESEALEILAENKLIELVITQMKLTGPDGLSLAHR